jgi:hypothetical protein
MQEVLIDRYYLSIATHSTASFAALSYLRVWPSYVDPQSGPKWRT